MIDTDNTNLIEKELEDYKKIDENYNIDGWIKHLKSKGYKTEIVADPDCILYF